MATIQVRPSSSSLSMVYPLFVAFRHAVERKAATADNVLLEGDEEKISRQFDSEV